MNPIKYKIQATHPESHLLDVICIIDFPDPEGQKVALPAWIPGSYLIRDFSRYIVSLKATAAGMNVPVRMLDKNTWFCDPVQSALTLSYQVYAYDLTPRGAHVDNTHAFFNGSRVFLRVIGCEEMPCLVDILPPLSKNYSHWQIATAMTPVTPMTANSNPHSHPFGQYKASHYEELIDHPVQMGELSVHTFEAAGTPHKLVINGQQRGDIKRLLQDLTQICETHIQFFGAPAPMEHYTFLLTVLGDGYGGLEHRASSSLQCRRDHLPKLGESALEIGDGYRNLLGLFSHEYFHTWNVKRIKPKAFTPYNLEQENYTRQLWIFEGITSYYDELALVRSKIISKESYLELLAQNITRVYSTPGRFKQTLEQSSFEAWTKFYKPDENSINATVSYYIKGALVALALDLLLRQQTAQRCSLDDIMRALWQRYGLTGLGLPEEAFEELVTELSGCNLKAFFDLALRDTQDLSLEPLLETVGVKLIFVPAASMEDSSKLSPGLSLEKIASKAVLEVKLKSAVISGNEAQIAQVIEGSAAQAAGLAPHDVIVAVNGIKVERSRLESIIASYAVGEEVTIHAFRRDELMTFKVKLRENTMKTALLFMAETMSEEQKQSLNAWLGN